MGSPDNRSGACIWATLIFGNIPAHDRLHDIHFFGSWLLFVSLLGTVVIFFRSSSNSSKLLARVFSCQVHYEHADDHDRHNNNYDSHDNRRNHQKKARDSPFLFSWN